MHLLNDVALPARMRTHQCKEIQGDCAFKVLSSFVSCLIRHTQHTCWSGCGHTQHAFCNSWKGTPMGCHVKISDISELSSYKSLAQVGHV
jgi:hypothetical protein